MLPHSTESASPPPPPIPPEFVTYTLSTFEKCGTFSPVGSSPLLLITCAFVSFDFIYFIHLLSIRSYANISPATSLTFDFLLFSLNVLNAQALHCALRRFKACQRF